MSASIDATLVIYVTCILLFFLLMFSLINFINHFQFNFECPYIIRDKEVGGIYPTLILLYISIACIVLGLITVLLSYEDPSDVTLSYSYCQRNFSLYTKSPFDFSFMKRKSGNPPSFPLHLVISFLLYMVFVLETYFSFSRYYNVCDIEHRLPLGTSFILYCVLFFVLIWLSITILPIISILFGIFHIFIISYFSYYFNAAVYVSYQHIIDMADFGHTNTYHEMKAQIKQIRQMAIFSVISSIITSVSWYSFALCSNPKQIQILPISLTINSILLFVMFSKNRRFIRNVLHCKGSDIQGACNGPCAMIIERRKQRQWIRDRQKSIFKRIQEGITVSRASKLKVSVSPKTATLPPSLNNSAADLHGSRTSIEICGDIDPMNDILQKRDDKPRQSLSIQSDISDVFVKMKSIGQTFRHKQHHSHAELAQELKQQIEHGTQSTKQVPTDNKKAEIETLQKEAKIIQLKKKTNRQISFGADMALEIIKETIETEENEEMDHNTDTKPQFNIQNKLKLFDHKSEPRLMSSYVYEATIQKQTLVVRDDSMIPLSKSHSDPNVLRFVESIAPRSHTAPTSPEDAKTHKLHAKQCSLEAHSYPITTLDRNDTEQDHEDVGGISRRVVFSYDAHENDLPDMANPLTLQRTVSEIQTPKQRKRVYSNSMISTGLETAHMHVTPADEDDGAYDYWNERDRDSRIGTTANNLRTPLTPGLGEASVDCNMERIDLDGNHSPYMMTHLAAGKQTSSTDPQNTMQTQKSKNKSILGSIRSMLQFPSLHHSKSISQSQTEHHVIKVQSFLAQNGLTQHHANVNELFKDMKIQYNDNKRTSPKGALPSLPE